LDDDKAPATRALLALRARGVDFRVHKYTYRKESVTESAAREVGVDEHHVVKTLVMVDHDEEAFVMLMHGDKRVSTKAIARVLGTKSVSPADPRTAERLTGYLVGGISPFGLRRELPIYVEASILDLPRIFINAGRRGLLVEMRSEDLMSFLEPIAVNVAR